MVKTEHSYQACKIHNGRVIHNDLLLHVLSIHLSIEKESYHLTMLTRYLNAILIHELWCHFISFPFQKKITPVHVVSIVQSLTVCTARQAHHCISSIYVYKYLDYFSKMIITGKHWVVWCCAWLCRCGMVCMHACICIYFTRTAVG